MFFKKKEKSIVIYLLMGCLWIIFSDIVMISIFEDQKFFNQIQGYRGWFCFLSTGFMSYFIIKEAFNVFREKQKQVEINYQKFEEMKMKLDKSSKELNKFQQDIIMSHTKMLEFHDKYTNWHSKSVANIAKKIAIEMNLTKKEINQVYWAGIVHDIGKILVPKDILNKNSSLTDDEYSLIKKHPGWGYQTLSQSKHMREIARYVLYHHERWDGKGYPEGLKGNEIPLISQILSLADSWDAMCSNRPYREALYREEAIQEIINNKGRQFAPLVVDIFLVLNQK